MFSENVEYSSLKMRMIEYHPKPNPRLLQLPYDNVRRSPEKCLLIVPYKTPESKLRRLNRSPDVQLRASKRDIFSYQHPRFSLESSEASNSENKSFCESSCDSDFSSSKHANLPSLKHSPHKTDVSWENCCESDVYKPPSLSEKSAKCSPKFVLDEKPLNTAKVQTEQMCCSSMKYFIFLFFVSSFSLILLQFIFAPIPISCLLQRKAVSERLVSKSLLARLKTNVAGQDELIEKVIQSLHDFLDVQNTKKLLILSLSGTSGVGKTLVLEETLRGTDFIKNCHFSCPDLADRANFRSFVKTLGVSLTSVDVSLSSISHTVTYFLDLIQLSESSFYRWFLHHSPSYQKMVLVIDSRPENNAEDLIIEVLKQREELESESIPSSVELQFLNANQLTRNDVSKCVDIELDRYSSQSKSSSNVLDRRKHSRDDYQRWVLDNVEFDENGFSLTGCKIVPKLISLI